MGQLGYLGKHLVQRVFGNLNYFSYICIMNFINEFLKGTLYGLVAQIITFLQLQGNIKWGLLAKYPILTLLASIPIANPINLLGHISPP